MIEIRQCHIEDFDDVVPILRQLWTDKQFDPRRARRVFLRALISHAKTYLCAVDVQRIVAFGSLTVKDNLWPEGHVAYVDELVVDSSYRNRGIGARLLAELVATARQRGCCRIELDSAFYREDAHRFYEHHGFERRAYVFSKVL